MNPNGTAGQPHPTATLGLMWRVRLLWDVWTTGAAVVIGLRRETLPAFVARPGKPESRPPKPPALLSRAASRGLGIGPWQPRSLTRALVLYRLLRVPVHSAVLAMR